MPRVEPNGKKFWQSNDEYKTHKRPNMKFYNSKAWRDLRAAFVDAFPFCQECLKQDKLSATAFVDHVDRINDDGDLLNWDKLRALCVSCDAKKRQKESREDIKRGLSIS